MCGKWDDYSNSVIYFQAQSDDDDVDEVQVGADTGGFMDEFFAQVSRHTRMLFRNSWAH